MYVRMATYSLREVIILFVNVYAQLINISNKNMSSHDLKVLYLSNTKDIENMNFW